MKVRYDPGFFPQYRKANVRIQNSFDRKFRIFVKNPNDLELNNHELKREWIGYRSIDIDANWRAIYKEIHLGDELIAYFSAIGTHQNLYSK